jgi:hypothetical protein
MHRVTGRLAAYLLAGLALAAPAAFAEPTDMKDLAKNPQNFLGQTVEMEGYCVKGGRAGDVLGYECTTEDGVYVDADDIEPEEAKEKLSGECAGGSCKMTVQFEPHSYTTSGVIEPGKSVTVFNAEKAKVSF